MNDGNISLFSSSNVSHTSPFDLSTINSSEYSAGYQPKTKLYTDFRHHTTSNLNSNQQLSSLFHNDKPLSFTNNSLSKSVLNLTNHLGSINPSKGRPFLVSDCYVSLPNGKKYVAINLLNQQTMILVIDERHTNCRQVLEYICSLIGLAQIELFGLAQLLYFESGMEYRFLEDEDKIVLGKNSYSNNSWINAASRSFRGLNSKTAGMLCKELNHPVIRQPSLQLYLRVKYFVQAPQFILKDPVTLEHYFLQLKELFLKDCQLWDDSKCYILAAYSVVSQFLHTIDVDDALYKSIKTLDFNGTFDDCQIDITAHLPKWVVKQNGIDFSTSHVPPICRTILSVLRNRYVPPTCFVDSPDTDTSFERADPAILNSTNISSWNESSSPSSVSRNFDKTGDKYANNHVSIPLKPLHLAGKSSFFNRNIFDTLVQITRLQFIKMASGYGDDFILIHNNPCGLYEDNYNNSNAKSTKFNQNLATAFPPASAFQNELANETRFPKGEYHNYLVYKLFKKRKCIYNKFPSSSSSTHNSNSSRHFPSLPHRRSISASTLLNAGRLMLNNTFNNHGNNNNHNNSSTTSSTLKSKSIENSEISAENLETNNKTSYKSNKTLLKLSQPPYYNSDPDYQSPDLNIIWLGVTPIGIQFFQDNGAMPRILLSTFKWAQIDRLSYEKDRFEVKHVNDVRKFSYYTCGDERSRYLLDLCKSTHIFNLSMHKLISAYNTLNIATNESLNCSKSYAFNSVQRPENLLNGHKNNQFTAENLVGRISCKNQERPISFSHIRSPSSNEISPVVNTSQLINKDSSLYSSNSNKNNNIIASNQITKDPQTLVSKSILNPESVDLSSSSLNATSSFLL